MSKFCLIRQPAGIGDIFFCQKIAKTVLGTGEYNQIIWPVIPEYTYIANYMDTDNIKYIDQNSPFENRDLFFSQINNICIVGNCLYVPLQVCDASTPYHDRRANGHIKYRFFHDLPHLDWKDFLSFKRNTSRELNLVDKLGIDLSEKYNVVNKNYGSPPGMAIRNDVAPQNGHRNIEMNIYPGGHIFDWLTIFEHAQEIHTVETSLYYLLEKLNLKNVSIYSKYIGQGDSFEYMKDHCCKEWKYIP